MTIKKGHLKNCGWAWHDENAITKLLALNDVKKNCGIAHDSAEDGQFIVPKDEHLIHFACSNNDSHCHDLNNGNITLANAANKKHGRMQ